MKIVPSSLFEKRAKGAKIAKTIIIRTFTLPYGKDVLELDDEKMCEYLMCAPV